MKVTTLLENNACRDGIAFAHGLSLYIETAKHKILFDMGPDEKFWENAEKLGIDLAQVDIAFLSHAHSDHAGGTAYFLQRNDKAKLYLQKESFGEYFSLAGETPRYIGVSEELKALKDRMVLCEGTVEIDEELSVFSGVEAKILPSGANATLHMKENGEIRRDAFRHEQNLLIREGGKCALFAGCAHNGIVNIMNRAEELAGKIDAVFAGFHLYNPSLKASEPKDLVRAVGEKLCERGETRFVTGHCTGEEAYGWLGEILGERIAYMAGGTSFEV